MHKQFSINTILLRLRTVTTVKTYYTNTPPLWPRGPVLRACGPALVSNLIIKHLSGRTGNVPTPPTTMAVAME